MPTIYRFLDFYTVDYVNKHGANIRGAKVVLLACSGGKYYDTITVFTSNSTIINTLSTIDKDTLVKPVFDHKARLVDITF